MNKPGFTLIELLVSTMIAAILLSLLFTAFYQINRFVPDLDNKTNIVEKAALVNSQLEKDFAGIIVPNEFYARQPKSKETASAEANEKKDDAAKKESEQKKKSSQIKNRKKRRRKRSLLKEFSIA